MGIKTSTWGCLKKKWPFSKITTVGYTLEPINFPARVFEGSQDQGCIASSVESSNPIRKLLVTP